MQEAPQDWVLSNINNLVLDNQIIDLVKKMVVFTLTWPSWVWKDTVLSGLFQAKSFIKPIQITTRKPRPWEVDWEDYYFISVDDFFKLLNEWKIFHFSKPYWDYYWFTNDEISRVLDSWKIPIFNVWPSFVSHLRGKYWLKFDIFSIFLDVPSKAKWLRRLVLRDWLYETDDNWTLLRNINWKKIRKSNIVNRIRKGLTLIDNSRSWNDYYDLSIVNAEVEETIDYLRNFCMWIVYEKESNRD